jgi:hypothetical protein
MLIGRKSIGFFSVCRSFQQMRDVEIAFSFWRRPHAEPGEIAYRVNFSLTWDWPRVWWSFIRN